MTDDDVRALFGTLIGSTVNALGHEEERIGGALAEAVLGFFPVVCGATRIEAIAGSLRIFVSNRGRGSTPHLAAVLVHEGVASSPVDVYLGALPETAAGALPRAKGGKPLATPADVTVWYEHELRALRKKVERRLRRIAAALAKGETGFYAHDAWPEA